MKLKLGIVKISSLSTKEVRNESPETESTPSWVEKFYNLQKQSEKCLEQLELPMKRAVPQKLTVEILEVSYKFTKVA